MMPPLLDDLIAFSIDEDRVREWRRTRLIREATAGHCRRIQLLVRTGSVLAGLGGRLQRFAAPCEVSSASSTGIARAAGQIGVLAPVPAVAPVASRGA